MDRCFKQLAVNMRPVLHSEGSSCLLQIRAGKVKVFPLNQTLTDGCNTSVERHVPPAVNFTPERSGAARGEHV